MLQSLHWLPIRERIHFKVLLLTYKAVHGSSISTGAGNQTCPFPQTEIWYCCSPTRQFMAPAYLQELVTKHAPSRRLRSGAQNLLKPLSTVPNTTTYGDRAFAEAAPKLWNALPYIIRQTANIDTFKSQRKTFFFQKFYGR